MVKTKTCSFNYYDKSNGKTVVMATAQQVSFCFFCEGKTVVMATAQQVSFCFFCDDKTIVMVTAQQVSLNISGVKLNNTAAIFPEIFFIQYFTILVANIMMPSLS